MGRELKKNTGVSHINLRMQTTRNSEIFEKSEESGEMEGVFETLPQSVELRIDSSSSWGCFGASVNPQFFICSGIIFSC